MRGRGRVDGGESILDMVGWILLWLCLGVVEGSLACVRVAVVAVRRVFVVVQVCLLSSWNVRSPMLG